MKREKSVYMHAKDKNSGFGIATDTSNNNNKFVVTAPSYRDLLTLTKGRAHCNASEGDGAEMLKNDIWAGNKLVVKYDIAANPIQSTGITITQSPVEESVELEPNGSLYGTDVDLHYTTTSQYKSGNKAIPMSQFRFPHRVALPP